MRGRVLPSEVLPAVATTQLCKGGGEEGEGCAGDTTQLC